MTRDAALQRLRNAEAALRSRGVARAALFGSVARGQAGPASDIDVLVELAPHARLDLFDYVGIVQMIQDIFPIPADVANRGQLKAHVREGAERDAVYAF